MRLITRIVFVVVLAGLAIVSSPGHVAAQKPVTTTVTRLYTGADDESHAQDNDVMWRTAKLHADLRESESVKVIR